jgi:ABC-type sulfate/molybdate transport systems ATPase subunit
LILLLEGRIAAQGTPRDVLDRPESAAVARFLGFTGQLSDRDGSVRYVRPSHVTLDPSGSLTGSVTRRVHEEDGVLSEVALDNGELQVRSPYPGPSVGERVTLRIEGGARFGRPEPSAT